MHEWCLPGERLFVPYHRVCWQQRTISSDIRKPSRASEERMILLRETKRQKCKLVLYKLYALVILTPNIMF